MKRMLSVLPYVVCPEGLSPETRHTIGVFLEEIELHTGLRLPVSPCVMGGAENVVIAQESEFLSVCPDKQALLSRLPAPGAEGFRLFFEPVDGKRLNLCCVGRDARGTLFGMGKLLRLLRLESARISADPDFAGLSDTPKYAMRGHQLGFRDKQNTIPCWSFAQMDRYIRDLALFGSNSIELLPPRTDDNLFSREMQVDPFDMMVHAAATVKSYGLDLWLWYPNMGKDYTDPDCVAFEMREREAIFSALPEIDGVLIPAGDPGDLEPDLLFPISKQVADILHSHHPDAKVLLAPQCFSPAPGWYEAFYRHVNEMPDWLYGVCFAPWEKDSIEEMAAKLPPLYRDRIRHYPDVTHDMGCQFALPNRDPAFTIIEGRECCDPRPRAMKHIHNTFAPYCMGSITYSEGVHDDVNKFVWGQQDWNPEQNAEGTVREYARYFLDPAFEQELTRGILLLEDNWASAEKIEAIPSVEEAYRLFLDVDSRAPSALKDNWRYQQLLLRALADHYIQKKAAYDQKLEAQARAILEDAPALGAVAAIRKAEAVLDLSVEEPCEPQLRRRLMRIADELRRSIGAKLTTHHHGGQRWGRGAWIDMIDMPLNDSQYLFVTMKRILRMETEAEKLAAIRAMLDRTKVGEGEVYLNIGTRETRACIATDSCWTKDPSLLHTPYASVDNQAVDLIHTWTDTYREQAVPFSFLTSSVTYYDQPLTLVVDGLTPGCDYTLSVSYGIGKQRMKPRLSCGGETLKEIRVDSLYHHYAVPAACLDGSSVSILFERVDRVRGVNVCELFMRKS